MVAVLPLVLEAGTALWVDAAGTLLHPAQPVAEVYAEFAGRFGHAVQATRVARELGPAMQLHRALRSGDPSWRAFWAAVIEDTTGVGDPRMLDALLVHYAGGDAWTVEPDARECLEAVRARGVRTALISNWDDRLRSTLEALDLVRLFDALLISGEEGVEKPEPEIFRRAAGRLSVPAERSLMVGDNPRADVEGARRAGAFVIQFGREISGFAEIMDSL